MNIRVTPQEEALILKEASYFGDKWGYIDTAGDNEPHY